MLAEMFRLEGKVALVTGGARDIGYRIADTLCEAGADVIITSRSLSCSVQAAENLRRQHDRDVLPLELDVSSYPQVETAAAAIAKWKPRVDVLINNAGGALGLQPTGFLERKPEHMRQLMEVNILGTLYCCQIFGRMMIDQGWGKIINIASIAGIVGRDRRLYAEGGTHEQPVDYSAAKAGMIGMTRDLAAYFGRFSICVNCISPGGFRKDQPERFIAEYSKKTPLGRMGEYGSDLQGAVLYLSCPASDYVTGHNLVVDGGYTIWN